MLQALYLMSHFPLRTLFSLLISVQHHPTSQRGKEENSEETEAPNAAEAYPGDIILSLGQACARWQGKGS